MRHAFLLPFSLASIAGAAPPTKYHNVASAIWAAIWAGLGGVGNDYDAQAVSLSDSTTSRLFSTPPVAPTATLNMTSPLSAASAISDASISMPTGHACAGNSASDRSLWCDHSIDTDYEEIAPDTGVTREYWLDLIQVTMAPDGVPRTVLTVNGTMPGPTIIADWGDHIVVHVRNSFMENRNGSSIHWYAR